jgi:hypothetical protein
MDTGDSGFSGKYPQARMTIPPEIPPEIAGFHDTALDGIGPNLIDYEGVCLVCWTSLDSTRRVTGGERGILIAYNVICT